MVPALADVGAVSALANSVEVERAGEALEVVEVLAAGGAGLEPLGLGGGSCAGGGDLDEIKHRLTAHMTIVAGGAARLVVARCRASIRVADHGQMTMVRSTLETGEVDL